MILPISDNAASDEDESESLELRNTLLKNVTENLTKKIADVVEDDVKNTSLDLTNIPDLNCDLKKLVSKLMIENEELKKQTVCKICMDPAYNKPLVITISYRLQFKIISNNIILLNALNLGVVMMVLFLFY